MVVKKKARKQSSKKKGNPWLDHVKEYRKKHPDESYSECLANAKKTYKS